MRWIAAHLNANTKKKLKTVVAYYNCIEPAAKLKVCLMLQIDSSKIDQYNNHKLAS